MYLWYGPLPVTVTTRIITCLGSGIPINLHFSLLQGGGHIQYVYIYINIYIPSQTTKISSPPRSFRAASSQVKFSAASWAKLQKFPGSAHEDLARPHCPKNAARNFRDTKKTSGFLWAQQKNKDMFFWCYLF